MVLQLTPMEDAENGSHGSQQGPGLAEIPSAHL